MVSTIDPVLAEEAPVSSELENCVASTINGLNKSSFLNSTFFLSNFFGYISKKLRQTWVSRIFLHYTGQELYLKNEECYQLLDYNKRSKLETYDWVNNSNEKVLFYTGLPRLEILC